MADPVNKQTRVAETLAEWLEHGDTVPVDALSSPPVTGSAAVALRHPEPAWVLREGAVLLARLGERYGAPEKLVSAWTVEMQMAARRLEDQAEEEARDRLRRQTRWTLRRDRLG